MILECICGRMFRVSDKATHRPTVCDACGGNLSPVGGTPSPAESKTPVPVDPEGGVRCPTCGDHFRVEAPAPKEKPRPSGPCCPKCGARVSLDTVMSDYDGIGWVGQEKMWYCPHCMSVLGFTAWKR